MHILSSRWLKVGVSIGLLALLLRSTNFADLSRHVSTVPLQFLVLIFVGYLAGQALSAYKWRLLARPLGFDQSVRTFTVYYFVGMYLNLFAPSIVVGDLGRGLLLAENGNNVGAALRSVVLDRASGMAMLLWVSAGGFVLFGPTVLPAALCYGTIAAALLSIISWWAIPAALERWMPQHTLNRTIERMRAPYQSHTLLIIQVVTLSIFFHLFQLALSAMLADALGLVIPFWYLVLFVPLVSIASALPLSFGGVGVRESGYVACLAFIGIGQQEALVFSLLWSTIVLAANLAGGLMFLISSEARIPVGSYQTTAVSEQQKKDGD